MPAALAALFSAGCGGGVISGPQNVQPPPGPRYEVSELTGHALSLINFNPRHSATGAGVTIMMIDSQVHRHLPLISNEIGVTYPTGITLDCSVSLAGDCNDHGSLVSSLMAGSHGRLNVIGPAHGSSVESLLLDELLNLETPEYVTEALRVFDESDAFVVNNSWGPIAGSVFTINNDRCLELVKVTEPELGDRASFCAAGEVAVTHPDTEPLPAEDVTFFTAMLRGNKERLGVWSSGNHGYNGETGVVCDATGIYCFDVREVRESAVDFATDEFTEHFTNDLYTRGQEVNAPAADPALDGHILAVTALEIYEPGVKDNLTMTVTVNVPTITSGNVLTTYTDERELGMAEYATACGDAMDHCLAAPGWGGYTFSEFSPIPCDTSSSYPSGLCAVRTIEDGPRGTSFSAPLVSAAAALLKSYWASLSPTMAATILLTTATDLGAPGVDVEYGHGMLNVSASFEPLGTLTTSGGVAFSEAKVSAGPAVQHALKSSDATFGMTDSMGRPYLYHLAGRVSSADDSSTESIEQLRHGSMSLFDAGVHERMGLVGDGALRNSPGAVGLSAGGWLQRAGVDHCLPSCGPHYGQFASALVPSTAVAWSEGGARSALGGRFGLVVEAGLGDAGEELTYRRAGLFHSAKAGPALLRLEAGALSESGTFLGSGFGKAFGVSDGEGGYASARVAMPIGDALGVSASYMSGVSDSAPLANSLVSVVEGARYDGFRLAAGGDGWELYHTVPVAATSGRMRIDSVGGYSGDGGEWSVLDTPEGVALVGEISHENWEFREDQEWVDLGAAERERVTGVLFGRSVGSGRLSMGAEHVQNSRGTADLGDEGRFVLSYSIDLR